MLRIRRRSRRSARPPRPQPYNPRHRSAALLLRRSSFRFREIPLPLRHNRGNPPQGVPRSRLLPINSPIPAVSLRLQRRRRPRQPISFLIPGRQAGLRMRCRRAIRRAMFRIRLRQEIPLLHRTPMRRTIVVVRVAAVRAVHCLRQPMMVPTHQTAPTQGERKRAAGRCPRLRRCRPQNGLRKI